MALPYPAYIKFKPGVIPSEVEIDFDGLFREALTATANFSLLVKPTGGVPGALVLSPQELAEQAALDEALKKMMQTAEFKEYIKKILDLEDISRGVGAPTFNQYAYDALSDLKAALPFIAASDFNQMRIDFSYSLTCLRPLYNPAAGYEAEMQDVYDAADAAAWPYIAPHKDIVITTGAGGGASPAVKVDFHKLLLDIIANPASDPALVFRTSILNYLSENEYAKRHTLHLGI